MKKQSNEFDDFTTWVVQHGPSKDREFLARYLGTPRPTHAIKTAQLKAYAKKIVHESKFSDLAWYDLLDQLYAGPLFEHRTLAGTLLTMLPTFREHLKLSRLEKWLSQQVGWCEIDVTCQSGWTAGELLNRWSEWQPFSTKLTQSTNISMRRASLVLLVSPLRSSNNEQLTRQALTTIQRLKSEKAVLITKAISWVLRSMIRQQPDTVRIFLDENSASLPAIAVRETRRKLDTGRK